MPAMSESGTMFCMFSCHLQRIVYQNHSPTLRYPLHRHSERYRVTQKFGR